MLCAVRMAAAMAADTSADSATAPPKRDRFFEVVEVVEDVEDVEVVEVVEEVEVVLASASAAASAAARARDATVLVGSASKAAICRLLPHRGTLTPSRAPGLRSSKTLRSCVRRVDGVPARTSGLHVFTGLKVNPIRLEEN